MGMGLVTANSLSLFDDEPDTEVDYDSGDRPKYRALAKQITAFYGAMTAALAAYSVAMRHLMLHGSDEEPFVYGAPQAMATEQLTSVLVDRIAGVHRTRDDFMLSTGGILQRQMVNSYVVGVQRGAKQMRLDPTLPNAKTEDRFRQLLGMAFDRLSEGNELRLEQLPAQVSQLLQTAQESALSRLETMHQFQSYADALASNDFQRISRTESMYGSLAGTSDQLKEYDVTHVRWIIGPNACPLCQEYEGREIEVDDWGSLPPLHPNCLCSIEPIQ